MKGAYPILTCEEAAAFEKKLLNDDEDRIWDAMSRVGVSLGRSVLREYHELGPVPESIKILILAGKGHNTGDAFVAASEIVRQYPKARVDVLYALGEKGLRPLVLKARGLLSDHKSVTLDDALEQEYHVCLDGVLGMSFKPPVREPLFDILKSINNHPNIRFRVAVDIPSGYVFRADFTYATGVAKTPLFDEEHRENTGRIRFLDIGFFKEAYTGEHSSGEFILLPSVLDPLRKLRKSASDKRVYGHLYILSGSRNYPGALLMSVKAALRAGLGLVTAFAPESLVPKFATEIPECMWVPWPETKDGTLAIKGKPLLFDKLSRGDALLTGPGLGDNEETLQLISEVAAEVSLPMSIDASALVPEVFEGVKKRTQEQGAVIATPHLGEFKRIAGDKSLTDWSNEFNVTTLLKGGVSKIAHDGKIYNSTFGGPVLARGGSGDILSGLIGGLLAQTPEKPLEVLCEGAVWHGMAADCLAREKGEITVTTTELLDFLQNALREGEQEL